MEIKYKWWPGTESNCRHGDFQSPALPTELPGHLCLVRLRKGFLLDGALQWNEAC